MTNFPTHINKTEAQIINRVITGGLANGGSISIFDGEEWLPKKSTTRADIQAEVATTDETTFKIRDKKGTVLGFVYFVHGNGLDVLSDYSDNEETELVIKSAMQYAQGF